jgi:hypothetical protein
LEIYGKLYIGRVGLAKDVHTMWVNAPQTALFAYDFSWPLRVCMHFIVNPQLKTHYKSMSSKQIIRILLETRMSLNFLFCWYISWYLWSSSTIWCYLSLALHVICVDGQVLIPCELVSLVRPPVWNASHLFLL